MEVINLIYVILSGILIFFLVFPFITVLLSLLTKEKVDDVENPKEFDYACIITAYKNAEITRPLIESLVKQNHKKHHIYLVADNCDLTGFDLEHEKLTVFCPDPPLNLKVKSIIHAVENFVRDHDYIAVFDGDNLAHPNFLTEINKYANNGYRSIQGQRTAKNLDTFYACADSLGEFYKNYIDRYVPYRLGSSSVISGSGMAVEADLYKSYLYSPEIEEGKHLWKKMLQEDKILQNVLLAKKERIVYAWNAVVYDEKVTSGDQVQTQRGRWIYSYFQNLPNSLGLIFKGIGNFSFNQILFGITTASLPLFILVFIAIFTGVLGLVINPVVALSLFGALAIFAGNILLVLYLSKVPKPVWNAVWGMPFFVWRQVLALFKMKDPNKNFKHSEHTRKYTIDEVLNKQPEHELDHQEKTQ